ncbi:MAG: hypothetical protein JSR45_15250 [Proteobacteria bacterium]|nr:hypothetical protein [Pseudomonadota bacterium]
MGYKAAGVGAFLLALVMAAPAFAADSWPKTSAPEFSVAFPKTPTEQQGKVDGIERHMYFQQGAKKRIFTVLVDSFPAGKLKGRTVVGDAQEVVQAFVERTGTEFVDWRPTKAQDHTGVEALLKTQDGDEMVVRFFMVGDKVITAIYTYRAEDRDPADMTRFFDSLVLK